MNDPLGDRLKQYEDNSRLMPGLPVIARLDGKNFHRYTKKFQRPFDPLLSGHFMRVAEWLARKTNANMTYTQSDEITLLWYGNNVPFDGRRDKMTSVLASYLTGMFNYYAPFNEYDGYEIAYFDARVFSVPNTLEAVEVFRWRELDASKNSVSMAARSVYSHKELNGKSSKEMQEMLFAKGINWNEYPEFFKRGTYIQRYKSIRKFTTDELASLPPKHEAHNNPDLSVERQDYRQINVRLGSVHNLLGFIVDGEEPITHLPKYPHCVAIGCVQHPYVL